MAASINSNDVLTIDNNFHEIILSNLKFFFLFRIFILFLKKTTLFLTMALNY